MKDFIELKLSEFFAVAHLTDEFLRLQKFSSTDLDNLRMIIQQPMPDGKVSVSFGLPNLKTYS